MSDPVPLVELVENTALRVVVPPGNDTDGAARSPFAGARERELIT